eukprot:1207117-Alexandrium_andersonii.AAC.1
MLERIRGWVGTPPKDNLLCSLGPCANCALCHLGPLLGVRDRPPDMIEHGAHACAELRCHVNGRQALLVDVRAFLQALKKGSLERT